MYSHDTPSPRYRALVQLYRRMHVEGDRTIGMSSERTFAGASVLRHVTEIKKLIDESGAQSLLDYGAGKGHQYTWRDLELTEGSRNTGGSGTSPSTIPVMNRSRVCRAGPSTA